MRDFSFADEDAPVVADICRRLDGIALAIELAAARVNILKPKELRARLDQRFRVLTGGGRDRLPRQQTLRALIDWSFDLLDDRERALFRRTGIFVDGFALEGGRGRGRTKRSTSSKSSTSSRRSSISRWSSPNFRANRRALSPACNRARAYAGKLDAAGEREGVARAAFRIHSRRFRASAGGLRVEPREARSSPCRRNSTTCAARWIGRHRGSLFAAGGTPNGHDAARRPRARIGSWACGSVSRRFNGERRGRAGAAAVLRGHRRRQPVRSKRALALGQRGLSLARASGEPRLLIDALMRCTNGATNVGDCELATAFYEELASLSGFSARQRLAFMPIEARLRRLLEAGAASGPRVGRVLGGESCAGERARSTLWRSSTPRRCAYEFGDTRARDTARPRRRSLLLARTTTAKYSSR